MSDILALSVEILDQVLEKVDTFLHLDFIHLQEILQREAREEAAAAAAADSLCLDVAEDEKCSIVQLEIHLTAH